MAVERAQERLEGANIRSYTVKASNTVRKGHPVKLDGDEIVEVSAVGDNAIGIARSAGNGSSTVLSETRVPVVLWGHGTVKALVGTGGATKGLPAKWASGGCTDGTVGAGTTKCLFYGQFEDGGLAGDLVGLNVGAFTFGVGS